MRALKYLAIVLLIYAAIVAAFESLIGTLQPHAGTTLVITTFGDDGKPHDRVVSRLQSDGKLYVAANHWPRSWYRRALKNPKVQASFDGATHSYLAVPVMGGEAERVESANPLPLAFRILTGFPPRYFLRLDPEESAPGSS
jgi:hypothetical protein